MSLGKLSNSEEKLMHIFWDSSCPLTSVDLLEKTDKSNWSPSYIQKLLNLLLKKEYITVCGLQQHGNHYVRQFKPELSKEEYIVQLLKKQNITSNSLAKIAVALIKKKHKKSVTNVELNREKALIEDLEHILSEYEQSEKTEEF